MRSFLIKPKIMACLTITPGAFSPGVWQSGNVTVMTANGATVQNINASGLFVTKNGVTEKILTSTVNRTHFIVFGTPANFVLGVHFDSGTASVVVFEITATGVVGHPLGNRASTELPVVSISQGAGGVFLITYHDSASGVAPIICRSDNGDPLTMGLGFFNPTGIISGEAVDTAALPKKLRILDAGNPRAVADWPVGKSAGVPVTINFPDVVIGLGVPASLTTQTKQGKIKNTGNDCLTISGLSNNLPFSIVPGSFSKTMPATLQPNDELTFDILFNPGTTAGSPFTKDLAINPTPLSGDTKLTCKGSARAPHVTISTNGPINFGTIRVGTSLTKNLVISNTGEADINLTAFPPPSPPVFNWVVPPLPSLIPYGTSLSIPITFTPGAEGFASKAISFSTRDIGGTTDVAHNVTAQGTGCVPHAVISLSTNIVDLGSVQKGFRTVRMFKVSNTGNAPLQFDAQIQPAVPGDATSIADTAFFGLLEDENTPVVTPLQSFSNKVVAPITLCGSSGTGSGEYVFGIAFFAGDVPRTINAKLLIFNHNDNTSGTPASFSINLTAEITNPVSVDVELVIDRSGSMNDPSGSRIKIETARDAAKLFVELMRPDVDDRLGLVRFNGTPEVISSFGIQPVTSANQSAIRNAINASNFTPSGSTCIAGGVMVAEDNLNNNPRATVPPQLNKVILVLTDGIDNTPYHNPNDGRDYSLLGGVTFFPPAITIPLPVPTDIKIYAIGIGDDIDVGRLGQLATSTGGIFLQTKEFSGTDYFNLEKHFTQVYMEAVNYSQVSDPVFTILAGETHQFDFEVLPGDKSAIIVLYDRDFRLPFWISTPTGEVIDLLSVPPGFQTRPGVSPTARFIEINMPQNEPERYAGTWKINVVHDRRACSEGKEIIGIRNFGPGFQPTYCKPYDKPIMYGIAIGVGSNFNMIAFVTPGIVKTGEPILLTAMVSEFGLPVKGCNVTVKAVRPDGVISHHTLLDDGNHQDDQANDGTYAIAYGNTFQEGSYTFTFTATGTSRDGKPMRREVVRSKYVEGHDPLVPTHPGGKGDDKNECCETVSRWVKIGILLLLFILIVLILIWRR
jgi:hypothetical protein